MTEQELSELDPEKLFIEFGPVEVDGREKEWKEICHRLDRLWKIEHMVILFPVLIAIVGLLLYVLASNAKIAEIGRIMFFAGTLATLLRFTPAITLIR